MSSTNSRRKPSVRSIADRDVLIEKFRHLPEHVVGKLFYIPHVKKMGFSDAVQCGFLGLIRAAELWEADRGVAFISYAYNAIANNILNQARCGFLINVPNTAWKNGRLPPNWARPGPTDSEFFGKEPYTEDLDPFLTDDFGEELSRVIKSLPPTWQAVLRLRFLQGKTQTEASKVLGVTRQTVSVTEARALKRVKKLLASENNGEDN